MNFPWNWNFAWQVVRKFGLRYDILRIDCLSEAWPPFIAVQLDQLLMEEQMSVIRLQVILVIDLPNVIEFFG